MKQRSKVRRESDTDMAVALNAWMIYSKAPAGSMAMSLYDEAIKLTIRACVSNPKAGILKGIAEYEPLVGAGMNRKHTHYCPQCGDRVSCGNRNCESRTEDSLCIHCFAKAATGDFVEV